MAARRQSYAALAHCSIFVSQLRELSAHEEKGAAGKALLEKINKQLQRTSGSTRTKYSE
jgi:hypothetical protein